MAAPPSFTSLTSLSDGGRILFATDEWFAAADNLLTAAPPTFIPEKFTDFGKWMDGWESRRKRVAGHDWCVLELGLRGKIVGVEIDTAFFTGNNAPRVCTRTFARWIFVVFIPESSGMMVVMTWGSRP
jgi:allantoicase